MAVSADESHWMEWLLQPPAAGEVRILVATGAGALLTPELRQALEQLASILQEQEIRGYSAGHYFIPFPRSEGDLRGFGQGEDAINFGFRALP